MWRLPLRGAESVWRCAAEVLLTYLLTYDASGRAAGRLPSAQPQTHTTLEGIHVTPHARQTSRTRHKELCGPTHDASRTQHTHGRSEATVERTGLGGRKAGAPARDRVELDVLVQAARVVARRAQEAPVHLRWEALRGQNAAAPGPYRRPAEHRSASSGELSQARMGHAARNGAASDIQRSPITWEAKKSAQAHAG